MKQAVDYSQESPSELVSHLLENAIDSRASDIHFSPQRESLEIRFRIDGILYLIQNLKTYSQEEIASRIKVLAQMDIAERRLPQDGHFEFEHKGRPYDIRVATSPTLYGEALVLRILNRQEDVHKIEDLGLEPDQLAIVNKIIASPYGIILITGPTASGKTTFLYSILNRLDKIARNIVTVEDPIEFQMAEVRQIAVEEQIGLTLAKAMRSVLRQDPDVIMVGEIRDAETAQMAFQSALGGVLLLSTFHTFDVPGLVIRLMEMGIPRSVVAHTLAGVVSTRLVRKICGACKTSYELSDAEKKILGEAASSYEPQKGKGCDACHKSGYLGRTGIFDIVHFDDEIRSYILEEKPAAFLKELLKKKTAKGLRDAAVEKVLNGVTTVEEVTRVIGDYL